MVKSRDPQDSPNITTHTPNTTHLHGNIPPASLSTSAATPYYIGAGLTTAAVAATIAYKTTAMKKTTHPPV